MRSSQSKPKSGQTPKKREKNMSRSGSKAKTQPVNHMIVKKANSKKSQEGILDDLNVEDIQFTNQQLL